MNIPRRINIFGTTYSIKKTDLRGELDGIFVPHEKTIYLEKTLKGQILIETFWHEVFHAVIHEVGIDQAIGKDIEEVIVTNLSKQVSLFYTKKK